MLFILAMDPLQRLLDMAMQQGVLSSLPLATARWRTSMYADDVAIFINLAKKDVAEPPNLMLSQGGNIH